MKTKDRILFFLEKNKGHYVSGSKLAESLGISRNAVWKNIKQLESDGYCIEAKTNLGYRLVETSDKLTLSAIKSGLENTYQKLPVHVFDSIDSTNRYAKELANNQITHGTIVVADEQTNGKGRYGKTFESPASSGMYISFVLDPSLIDLNNISLVTLYTAVCVQQTIHEATGISLSIKWVNDLYYHDKKVCGILTEAITNVENSEVKSLVVGIGLNISTVHHNFSTEVRKIASSLFEKSGQTINRNELTTLFINNFLAGLSSIDEDRLIKLYDSFLMWKNEKVNVIRGNQVSSGIVRGIATNGNLVLEDSVGEIHTFNSGEIQIKK
ncbi:biotin--[acetyl-CoA-carboxylase] ligase [Vagococcus vulneris]|uniref:Bifunctional ligase/repressor BirA n=1 Tax=Vagococcus vulneris TaxID=1977869 RepID=A0A429ZX23_9ENTE|nr:biotin--[acetyl-CoA-carboxylase] ligase [Vagococcus vulneris]RST98393.1 biotin--[acetyl-CoA-carboxylase] ligase [Vagococcus vulneris]